MTDKEVRTMFYQAIRLAVAGATVSEPVHELLMGVGKEESLRRIQLTIDYLTERQHANL